MDWSIFSACYCWFGSFRSANVIKVLCVRTLYTISNISMPVL